MASLAIPETRSSVGNLSHRHSSHMRNQHLLRTVFKVKIDLEYSCIFRVYSDFITPQHCTIIKMENERSPRNFSPGRNGIRRDLNLRIGFSIGQPVVIILARVPHDTVHTDDRNTNESSVTHPATSTIEQSRNNQTTEPDRSSNTNPPAQSQDHSDSTTRDTHSPS